MNIIQRFALVTLLILVADLNGMAQEDPFIIPGVTTIAWHPSALILAYSNDDTITVIDSTSIQGINALTSATGNITALAWSNDGEKLAYGAGIGGYIWANPLEGNNIFPLQSIYPPNTELRFTSPIATMAWDPLDQFIAAGIGGLLLIWNTTTLEQTKTIYNDWSRVNDIDWQTQDQLSVANQDSNLYIVNIGTQETEKQYFALGQRITPFYALDRNASGSQLAASWDDGFLLVWDVQNADVGTSIDGVRVFGNNRAHDDSILSVDWSPNDLWIASGSLDGTAKIWDAQTRDLIQTIEVAAPGTSVMVSWSPDSTRLAYIAQDATLPTIIEPVLPIVNTPTPEPTSTPPPSLFPNAGADATYYDLNNDGSTLVQLDASASTGEISSYAWTMAGNPLATGTAPLVSLPLGFHEISLAVSNAQGQSATDSVGITVAAAPAGYQALRLQHVCMQADRSADIWRVTNPNAVPVMFWYTRGHSNDRLGTHEAPGNGSVELWVNRIVPPLGGISTGASLRILVDNVIQAQATVNSFPGWTVQPPVCPQ